MQLFKVIFILLLASALISCASPDVRHANDFPSDATGTVLRGLQKDGDDLSVPRDIEFTVVMPSEDAAKKLAEYFKGAGYKINIELTRVSKDLPWDVVIVNHMIPSYEGIIEFEKKIESVAGPLGGEYDGWGCFAQSK